MFEFIDKAFEGAKQKPVTIKNRIGFLKSIATEITPAPTDLSFLRKEKIVLARVNDSPNILTQYNRLCHIVKAIEVAPDLVFKKTMNRYVALLKKLKPQKIGIENDNRLTEEQKARYLTLRQVYTKLEFAIKELLEEYGLKRSITADNITRLRAVTNRRGKKLFNFAKRFQQISIAACYVYQPAIRNNFGLMKVTKQKRIALKDKEFNYYYIDNRNNKAKIIMNQYKNDAHLGQVTLDVNEKLRIILKNWLFLLGNIVPGYEYLFYYSISSDGTIKHSNNQTTIGRTIPRIFEKITGRPLSINDMRHIHEIALQKSDEYRNATVAKREELHKQLLHGHLTGLKYNLLYTEQSKNYMYKHNHLKITSLYSITNKMQNSVMDENLPKGDRRNYKKAYYQVNKERMLEQNRNYKKKDPQRWKDYARQFYEQKMMSLPMVQCECSRMVREDSIKRHILSRRHIRLLEEQKAKQNN